jgi:hypothetical protein
MFIQCIIYSSFLEPRSVFSIAPRLRGSNPVRGKRFICSPKRPHRLWGPPSLLFSDYGVSFRGVKLPWHKVNHSSPSGTEVKNEWSYPLFPLYAFFAWTACLDFTFFYLQTHSSAAVDKIRQRERLLRNKSKDFSTCHGRIYLFIHPIDSLWHLNSYHFTQT